MEKSKGLSGFDLKIIAIITMFIDHISLVLIAPLARSSVTVLSFEECIKSNNIYAILYITGRLIGRMSFLIYCFCLVIGFKYTKSRIKYAMRLSAFALISEIPFDLALKKTAYYPGGQNVFFTLLLGFLAIWIIEKCKSIILSKITWLMSYNVIFPLSLVIGGLAGLLAEFIKSDYKFYGVATIVMIYAFMEVGNNITAMGAGSIVLIASNLIEIPVLLDIILVAVYNGKRGKPLKYIFYIIFPLHFCILYLIYRLIY